MQSSDIEGRWSIVSWRQEYDDGRVVFPMGDRLTGFVQYHDGRVVVMISDGDRPNFVSGGQWDASNEEKVQAYKSALFYSGTFRIEGDLVFHEIDIASFPNWVGGVQKRAAELDGKTLRLKARLEEGTPEARSAVLTWRRT